MPALIDLCNLATAEIGAGHIDSLNEGSIESIYCNRLAQPLLNEIIDWADDWPLGRTRAVLAAVTNDREAEWAYKYALPADFGAPIAIREVAEEPAYSLPVYGPSTFPWQDATPIPFVVEGNRLFTNVETATLVYSRSTITASDLSPLLARAFVLELAARLSVPVKKDPKLRDMMRREAELAKTRAIVDERNKSPMSSPRYVSEVEYARAGILAP